MTAESCAPTSGRSSPCEARCPSGCHGRTSTSSSSEAVASWRPHRAPTSKGHWREEIATYFQSAGAEAERRIRLFRLAWDFLGSELGGRGELYERFYLSDSWRMTALAYTIADKSFPESLVEPFLGD